MKTALSLLFGCIAIASPLAAQQRNADASVQLPNAESSDDIVVSSLRIPREKLPVQVHWAYQTLYDSTIVRDNAAFFLRCAFKNAKTGLIRDAIEGPPNFATTRFASARIVQINQGCYLPRPINAQAYLQSGLIERGVLFQLALAKYAPDATLTKAETFDAATTQRMLATEEPRNRYRLPNDRDAFRISVCLVQHQPKLATRFVHAEPGSLLERGLAQTLLVDGRECLGQTKRVSIDPAYLNFYVTEAFYRWVVAARNVDSLIPMD